MDSNIVFSGIAPHPPLLVPEIGGHRIQQVSNSRLSLIDFSKRLVDSRPDTVVLISPHSPFDPDSFTARGTANLDGDFGEFKAPGVSLSFHNDLDLISAVARSAEAQRVPFRELTREYPLDHGAMVPLYYLHEAGWNGPVVVFGFTNGSNDEHLSFGRVIRDAVASIGRRIAVVASGDLSHRLVIGGPYEYEPTAHQFDEQIVAAIADGSAAEIVNIDPALRTRAGECGYRSILVALGSVGYELPDHQVLSYEGPFGVGYMVAVLVDSTRRSA